MLHEIPTSLKNPEKANLYAQPVHRNFRASINCFIMDSTRHGTFGCDLQNRFDENAKKCNTAVPSLTSFLTCSVMERVDHKPLIKHFRSTKLSEYSEFKQVYRQLKFEYVCLNRCQVMGKVHVIVDNHSYCVLEQDALTPYSTG